MKLEECFTGLREGLVYCRPNELSPNLPICIKINSLGSLIWFVDDLSINSTGFFIITPEEISANWEEYSPKWKEVSWHIALKWAKENPDDDVVLKNTKKDIIHKFAYNNSFIYWSCNTLLDHTLNYVWYVPNKMGGN